jgi:hypothetical protein
LIQWEERFFWGARRKRTRQASLASEVLFDEAQHKEDAKPKAAGEDFEDVKPLAEELIDTLIDLLFFSDFTLPRPQNSKNKVSYAIWQSGVGCNTSPGTSKEFENNRCEILRLLLTLTSPSMYMSANLLPVQGVRAITYIATCPDKQIVLSVLCSLLNTVCAARSCATNPANAALDPQVQSLQLEGAVWTDGIQRFERNACYLRSSISFGHHPISYTRSRSTTNPEELL